MSKITNYSLTRSGTGCFMATFGVKGLNVNSVRRSLMHCGPWELSVHDCIPR